MIRLRTLGGVDLRDAAGQEIRALLAQPKRLGLLVYLAIERTSGYRRRDKVVALLWPELDEEHARGSLRQALTFLRRTLGAGVIVSRGEDEIGIETAALDCDAREFIRSCEAGLSDEAMVRYQGDFLDGFLVSDAAPEFQTWVEEERTALRKRAASCLWSIVETRRRAGDASAAVTLARRAAMLSPDDERGVARLIMCLDDIGDRAGAIAVYEDLAARLEREYDAEPAPETQALIRRVRHRTHTVEVAPPAVALESTPLAAPHHLSLPHEPRPGRRPSRMLLLLAAIGVFTVLSPLIAYVRARAHMPLFSATDAVTVAVLPLRDLSGDNATQYVADGLTDELITSLAQGNALRVISTRTMLMYRDSMLALADIARRLNADAVVTGTVQHVGDTVHQTIQLNRAGDERAVFGRSFSGTRGELLRLQRDVAHDVLRVIAGSASVAHEVGAPREPGTSEAVDLYIRGRYYWSKRGGPNLLKAIDLFSRALDVDPLFARAYSGMADAYVQLGYASLLAPKDAFPKAEAAARRAVELDSTLAEPYAALGFVSLYYSWDWAAAERAFKKSIALNSSYSTAHEWYGLYLTAMRRFDEAIHHERRAQELDPLSAPTTGTAAWVLYYAGRLQEARREVGIALRMDSTYALGHFYLGRIFQAGGQLDSALAQYAATGALRTWIPTLAAEGYVQARLGRRREAAATLVQMDSASHTRYVTAYGVALVHAALGRPDSAFAWLRRAKEERTNWMVWLDLDPRWSPIRNDPRFDELVRQAGLPR